MSAARSVSLAGMVLLLASLGGRAALAAPPSPPPAPCSSCHDQPGEWKAKKAVHAPVAADECLACHSPHASRHGSLLRRDVTRTCLSCHEDLGEAMRSGRRHGALVTERACLTCHEPHAADRENLLAKRPVELCVTCHENRGKLDAMAHPHPPAADGECLSCHDPHVSKHAALRTEEEPALCTACHDTADAALAKAHKGIAISAARCASCHDPHGSESAGMMRAAVHPPFAEGTCEVCHEPAGKPAAEMRSGAKELCLACHDAPAKGHRIPGAGAGACVACHTPHASSTQILMRGREEEVCLACHEGIKARRERSEAHHPPMNGSTDCTLCHQLHTGAPPAFLKKQDVIETCSTCHAGHSEFSHPMGKGVMDPSHPGKIVDCISCHDPHGTPYKAFLLADPARDLCVRCHTSEIH